MSKKRTLPILCLLLALLVALPFITVGISGEDTVNFTVTPALNVLANDVDFVKNAVYGEAITFTAQDLDAAFGMDEVSAITILSLPPAQDGTLCLGEMQVLKNQTIARKDFSLLRFVPRSASVCDSSFLLCNEGDGMTYQIPCTLLFSAPGNNAPVFVADEEYACQVSTVSDIAIRGRLRARDPEGDALTFSLQSYPQKGILVLEDAASGVYTYYPKKGCTGKDTFSYTVRDCFGNASAVKTVEVNIVRSDLGVVYTDLINHDAHYAAIILTQANIMSGVEVGGYQFFYPEKSISRTEFLVMAMKSANYAITEKASALTFTDKDEIAPVYADYVATAVKNGIVEGDITESGTYFYPNQTITRAEAAVIVQRLLSLPVPTASYSFADHAAIPAWAHNAISALCSVGIMEADETQKIRPTETMCRADSAKLLYALYDFCKG